MIGTNNFINECKKDKVTYKEYIVIDDVPVEVKAQMYQTAYKDTTFFGTFNLNYINFKTENNISYKNKDFVYYKTVNGETQQIGHYYVTEVIDNDTEEEIQITAFDDGIKFNNKYTTSLNYRLGTITLYDVLQECCTNCNVVLKNESITNGNFIVDSNQFEETATYGDVICAIAQMSGGFAFINYEGKLEIRFANQTNEIIEDYVELEDKRDTQPITSVLIGIDPNIEGEYAVREDSSLVEQYGRNWLKIYGNPFAYTVQKREYLIDAIFNQVKGFGYSAFTVKDSFLPYFELGDLVQFKNKQGQLVSSIILRIETEYDSIELSAPSITNAEVDYIKPTSDSEITRNTRIQVDKAKQEITSMAGVITEQNTKISRITQTVDELNSKISEIADITISQETNSAKLIFEEINASEPISINIHPIVEHISYTYPYTGLFPSDYTYLKTRTLRFTNRSAYEQTTDIKYTSYRKYYTYDSQNNKYDLLINGTDYQVGDIISGTIYQNTEIDYEIPSNLYYYDADNYDEFILDYGDGIEKTCVVNKKVGINADGSTYLLDEEQIITYPYPTIPLTDGDYEVALLGYEVGYLFARLMAKNIYVTQFATRVEMNTAISQKADEINLGVDYKLTAYPTITEMNSAINLSANSITSTVRETYATKATVNTLESKIEQKASSIVLSVSNGSVSSGITISLEDENGNIIDSKSGTIQMTGLVKFTDLSGNGTTTINGNNITTGIISADRIDTANLKLGDPSSTITEVSGEPIEWLNGLVPSPSGDSYSPIAYFGAFNRNQMNYPRNSVGAEIWENGEFYLRRVYTESGASSTGYMGFIKTELATDPISSVNYIIGHTSAGSRGISVSTYAESFDIYAAVSDEQLKENIVEANINALDTINQIKLISFNWKDTGEYQKLGFSAQQLEGVCEDFVGAVKQPEGSKYDEILQVKDFNILPYMLKAIQELHQEIEELKERIK